MRFSGRLATAMVTCCVVAFGGASATVFGAGLPGGNGSGAASGAGSSSAPSSGVGSSASLNSLVVPGVQGLDEGQQQRDHALALHASPAAVAARQRSRMEFHGLDAAQAAQVAASAFPTLLDQRDGGTPSLPAGEKITGYLDPNAAQLSLGHGKRGVVESIGPMAKETSHGHFAAIDLGLKNVGGNYVPAFSSVSVRLPKRLADGISAPGAGVSLTPVDAQGAALGGSEGSMDGTSVIYPNTETDTDTVAKPTSVGFEISAILRSVDSPRELYYRLEMPNGARVVQKRHGGSVQILDDGAPIATIFPPNARDADGTTVPAAMSVNGQLLVIDVGVGSGEYAWPIEVDPEVTTVEDRDLTGSVFPEEPYTGGTSWTEFSTNPAFHYEKTYSCGTEREWCEQSWYIEPRSAYNGGEFAGIQYKTKGISKLYKLEAWVAGEDNPNGAHTQIEFKNNKGTQTNAAVLSTGPFYKFEPAIVGWCVAGKPCENYEAPEEDSASILTYTGKAESIYGFWMHVWAARAYIAQEKGPEASFNTGSSTITTSVGSRPNVLYGTGSWLGPDAGAYEVVSQDNGLGVSYAAVNGPGLTVQRFIRTKEGDCAGVECNAKYVSPETYAPGLANGEDSIKFYAEDAAGLYGDVYKTVKVDSEKPYNLEVVGWPKTPEISAAQHTLTISATDGTKPTPSSGVKSISVSIDGGPASIVPGASCAPGECTASGKYTLDAEGLSEGVHRLTVAAIDNASNERATKYTFDVRHGSPISVGPGSVDPTTGQFSLSANDVGLSGTSGVSRTYESRNLTAGAGGPLGPQWAISIGAGQNLVVLPEGSVVLSASNGGRTTFTRNKEGKFESPLGDGNLKIEAKELVKGKGITEYVLSDASGGTTTKFTQPTGTENTAPLYTNQFGAEISQLSHPVSDAVDSAGNVWVADTGNNRLEEFEADGTLKTAYGSAGPYGGELMTPWGVAVNQSTGNVYVTDQGNNRVEELSSSGEFLKAFGWGVTDGKAEFEICTSYCQAGIAGAGNGQFNVEAGIAIDSSGNVWVADYGNDRVQVFNEKGEYKEKFGSLGSGNGQFKGPLNIAFSGGHAYVTDYGNDRVQEFSTAGAYISQFGSAGSGNGQFSNPYGIAAEAKTGNLYVADEGNNRIQEFTASGTYVAKFGAAGAGNGQFNAPTGVVVSGTGGIYVVDDNNSRVQEWTRPLWMPSLSEGALPSAETTYAYKALEVEGETVIEPTEALAPPPAGVTCGTKPEELKKGCRALTFAYDEGATTAKGENPSEWGNYKGHLERVEFHGWNPSTSAMTKEVYVAQYEYDAKGRLRAEWDPRISSALKTTYGYDAEGHITSTTASGQQSWAFTDGTISGDPNTGRLLKVTRAQPQSGAKEEEVKTRLKEQKEQAKNTEAPKLSGTAVVGVTLGVSNGKWSNAPVAYGYQWQDCTTVGKECTAILGATNENYTATSSDIGHTLVVQVEAANGAGSVVASSAPSALVSSAGTKTEGTHYAPGPGWTVEYRVSLTVAGRQSMSEAEVAKWGQIEDIPKEATAIFAPDEPMGWPASDYKRATITYMDEEGRTTNTSSPSGGVSTTEYNPINEVERTLSADNRAIATKESCETKEKCKSAELSKKLDTKSTYNKEGAEELLETLGPEHEVKLAGGSEVLAREHVKYKYNQGAKEVEEKTHETYDVVTESTASAQYSGKEADELTTKTSYSGEETLGWKLRKPTSVTTDPSGLNLTHTTMYDLTTGNVNETTSPMSPATNPPPAYASKFGATGTEPGQFTHPMYDATDSSGNVWVADGYDGRVEKFFSAGTFVTAYGKAGEKGTKEKEAPEFEEPVGIAINQSTGNVYVADQNNSRVVELSSAGTVVRVFGKAGTGGGEFKEPNGVAIDSKGNVWVTDYANNRVQEFTEAGVFVKTFGFGVSNGESKLQVCTTSCRAGLSGTGSGEFSGPADIAFSGENIYVTDLNNSRVEELKEEGKTFVRTFGSVGAGNGQFKAPSGIAVGSSGNVYVADSGNSRVEEFSSTGSFLLAFGTSGSGNGQFSEPEGVTVLSSGTIYVTDAGTNNRVEKWISNAGGAHTSQSIYYSAAANATYKECGEHPEWVNLVCRVQPGGQPEDGTSLPVKTLIYNVWDEIEKTTETYGSTTRTITQTYDAAGRALTSETTSTIDTALPKVTNEYNSETGLLEKQSTTTAGKTKTITSQYDTLGQLVKYTDAAGSPTTYEYEAEGDDRLDEVNDGKGTQTYSYDSTTGFMTKLIDSAAGTFIASYDAEGKMLTEGYPNNMTATYSFSPVGQTIGLSYVKNSDCATKCPETWFSDATVPSIHGETLQQTSTLSKENYSYDTDGRLTQTQEEPLGKGCVTRLYAYDEESNRTSLTTREPNGEGKCASEGGTVERHVYDTANRLIDAGVVYEAFGNMTTLPSADAGGHELASSYYVDGQAASQTQNEKTINYHYDPAGRAEETETLVKGKLESTVVDHYSGVGEALTWTSEEAGKKWSRNIPGIDGALDAVESSSGGTELLLHDLQGNVVAKAGVAEAETKLLGTYNSTEFGVPNEGKAPPTYAWLGATGVSTELSSGVATKGGASYVPQVALDLQTEPVIPPGSFPDGEGEPTPYTATVSSADMESSKAIGAQIFAEIEAARQESEKEEACIANPLSCVEHLGDPPPIVTYLSVNQAANLSKNIRNWIQEGNEAQILGALWDLEGFAVELLESDFSGDAVEKYDEFLAGKLEYCVGELEFWGAVEGGCRISQPTEAIGELCVPTVVGPEHCARILTLPDLNQHPEVSFCGEWVEKRLGECVFEGV